MAERRVVVTGMGIVSPMGNNLKAAWQNILAGKSGISRISRFDPSNLTVQIAGEVKNFDISDYLPLKDARKYDTFVHYGYAAAKQAIDDAGLDLEKEDPTRMGCAVGSGIGGLPWIIDGNQKLETAGQRRVSPFYIPGGIINMAAGFLSIQFNLKGPSLAIVSACTTGTHSIGHAARMIKYGDAEVMLAGGTEMATCPIGVAGFAAARALSTRNDEPLRASRPWDKGRDGFVLGEGAGILILEEYEHAKKRGAKIYAELCGFGMSSDAYHMTALDEGGEGPKRSMLNSLKDAGISPDKVDYINAHGTSTPAGDVVEARSVKLAFGDHAKVLSISSTKSMTGHLLGAAGAIEAIFTVKSLDDQVVPPTINLEEPDEGCDLDFVAGAAKQRPVNVAISNSFGFGGTNGTLVFSKI
ncbi:MAG: beta-ketoacyl-[acyl-carrier-protein] synthase II [Coxiella sp. RIFCSPHIGHO2_12_FULL_44_14]|nr:MAG: beta-ketoacyl-[acyl-carrier-protein] synthase II [Coxiella sp. RIFCSPHIGHO2_12_FULL_44_14]